MFTKYDNINCFALFLVTNDMSTRHTSIIRNYSCELSCLLQIKQLKLALLLKQAMQVGKRATSLSSPFISCKILRGEDGISQKRTAISFRTTEMSYCSMHIKYPSLSFGSEGLFSNSRSSMYSILDVRPRKCKVLQGHKESSGI